MFAKEIEYNKIELKNRLEGDIKMTRETDQNENPFWVFAVRKTGEYSDLTPNSGKTIATFRFEEDIKNLLKGKARQDIIGRKYRGFDYLEDSSFSKRKRVNLRTTDGYKKYLFEIYRPLTLQRIGLDGLTKIDIRDGAFACACVHYGRDDIVFDTQDVYERTIEILLDMNVPIYACSTDFPRDIETAEFDMFVDEKYAKPVKHVFHTVCETDFKRFFGRRYKRDEDFSDAIRCIANEILFGKTKEDDIEDDGWVDIIR
jgi:hypothetical protein